MRRIDTLAAIATARYRSRQHPYLRMKIDAAHGAFPTLREVEVFDDPHVRVAFPDWIAAVATIDRREWDDKKGEGRQFIPLARGCPGWQELQAQYLWLDSFDDDFVSAEPRPLCGFLSGNFSDFCQKDRAVWRGTDQIVKDNSQAGSMPCDGIQESATDGTLMKRRME